MKPSMPDPIMNFEDPNQALKSSKLTVSSTISIPALTEISESLVLELPGTRQSPSN